MVPGRLAGATSITRGLDSCWSTCPGYTSNNRAYWSITAAVARKAGRQTEASLKNSFFRWLLALAFLPYAMQIATDAIVKTLVRLGITHRGLLRWTTSDQVARRLGDRSALATWLQMTFSPILAIVLVILITLLRPTALAWAAPLLAAWFLAPGIAVWVSRPLPWHIEELDDGQGGSCAGWRAAPGFSLNSSSALRTSGCPPTIFRKLLWGSSPTALRRPTSAWHCFLPWGVRPGLS